MRVRVYLEGTGNGDAVTAFAQLSKAANHRGLVVRVEDPVALANGFGRFFVGMRHVDIQEDAVAVVRAMLDQVPDGGAAFELASVQESGRA
jgi:hypothetical protein